MMSGKAGDNYEGWGEPRITAEQVEAAHKVVLQLQKEMDDIGVQWDAALKAADKTLAGELQQRWLNSQYAEHSAYYEYAELKRKFEYQQRNG